MTVQDETLYDYFTAFDRNRGLVSLSEQKQLSSTRISICGCGGVGGVHALTFARLGVGKFILCDPDTFSVANFNRQVGATITSLGQNKAVVIANMIKAINPDAEITVFQYGLSADNVHEMLSEVDLVVDGLDFFALSARRILFKYAWDNNITAITAAPLGFSGAVLTFTKQGMSFDSYFDITDSTSYADGIINFLLGLAPAGLHIPYMDFSAVDAASGRGPSSIIGVQMASCLLTAEALRFLLNRGSEQPTPHYLQFDPYQRKLATGYLRGGNRNWKQRIKRRLIIRKFQALGLYDALLDMKA